jgi:hypothetical protein
MELDNKTLVEEVARMRIKDENNVKIISNLELEIANLKKDL